MNERKFEIGLGVVDITQEQKNTKTETPQKVRDRILEAADTLEPGYIFPAPDCGLRQLSLDRSIEIYEILAEGTELARKG